MTWVWLAGICLQIVLAIVLVTRRVWRKFPIFFLYFTVNLLMGLVQLMVSIFLYGAYFYCYWISQGLVMVLGVGVVLEVFLRLLTPYPTIRKTVVPACILVVVFLANFDALVIFNHNSSQTASAMARLLRVEEALRVLQAGIVVFLYFCAGLFRLHFRQVEFGIALGLGVYAALELLVVVMIAHLGVTFSTSLPGMLAFDIAVLIWLKYLGGAQPAGPGQWPNSNEDTGR